MTDQIIIIAGILLFFSHIAFLAIGFHMGSQIQRPIEQIMSKQTKPRKDVTPFHDTIDIFNEETVDLG